MKMLLPAAAAKGAPAAFGEPLSDLVERLGEPAIDPEHGNLQHHAEHHGGRHLDILRGISPVVTAASITAFSTVTGVCISAVTRSSWPCWTSSRKRNMSGSRS